MFDKNESWAEENKSIANSGEIEKGDILILSHPNDKDIPIHTLFAQQ